MRAGRRAPPQPPAPTPRALQPPAPTSRELLLAALCCVLGVALLFVEPLFLGRCTLAFRGDDPRIDVRPWARPATGALEDINPIAPDMDGFVLPGWMRMQQLMATARSPPAEPRADAAAHASVASLDGHGPWWDGRQMLGYPLAGNLPYPLFAPATWMLCVLPPVTMLDVALALHTALAALLAWRAVRLMGGGGGAAALGAVGFALSAWAYHRWHSAHEVYTLAWWPGQLAALEWLRRGRLQRGLIEGALFTGLMLAAGFPQVGVVLCVASVLLALLDPILRRPRALLALAAALLLGVGLAAPQLLISAHAYEHSLRSSAETRAATAARGLPPAALAGALLPEFFGRPSDWSRADMPAPRMEDWLPQRLWLGDQLQNSQPYNALYPGVLVLLLLPVALSRAADPRARALALCALAAVAGALLGAVVLPHIPGADRLAAGNIKRLLAMTAACAPLAAALALPALHSSQARTPGPTTTVAGQPAAAVSLTSPPAARRARVPWRTASLLLALIVAAPLLAARLDDPQAAAFSAGLRGQSLRQALCVLAGLAALWWWARCEARRTGAAAVPPERDARRVCGAVAALPALVLLADLAPLALAFNPFPEQTPPFPATPTLAILAQRPGRYAVFGTGPKLLPPTAAALHGISAVHGVSPMVPARAAELLACIEGPLFDVRDPRVARPFTQLASLEHPLLDLLAVRTVVHADRTLAQRSGLAVVLESEEEGLGVLARDGVFPRAFLCGGARVVPDAEARLALLAARPPAAEAVDLRGTVLIEEPLASPLPEHGAFLPVADGVAWRDAGGLIELAVEAPFPGVLVLNEAWDAGWHAELDGREQQVLIADHALLALELPAGSRRVVFRYEPPGLRLGLLLAAVALAVVTLLGARAALAARPSRASVPLYSAAPDRHGMKGPG